MEINKELKVEAHKNFEVSVDKLYDAWTNPEQLKKWWKPNGKHVEGSNERYKKKAAQSAVVFNGNKLVISGEYLEVNEKEKLIYTWKWELPEDAVRNAQYKLSVLLYQQATEVRYMSCRTISRMKRQCCLTGKVGKKNSQNLNDFSQIIPLQKKKRLTSRRI